MAKISKIEVQKRNSERVNIFLDGEYAFSISMELAYKEGVKVNSEIDAERLKEIANKESFIMCRESALRIIERNYKTEKEVREKLVLKGYEQEAIDKAIDFLKEYKFLDDGNYTKMFIKNKLNSQGSQKIKYSLMQKGVSKEVIEKELSNVDREEEKISALNLAKKKINTIMKRETDTYKISGKLYRFLMTKGFNYELVKEVVKEVMSLDEFN